MGYWDPKVRESKNKNVQLGRKIYMLALCDRRGFREDQLGISDTDIWLEIFEHMGRVAKGKDNE